MRNQPEHRAEHVIVDHDDIQHLAVHDTAGNDYVVVRRDDYDNLAAAYYGYTDHDVNATDVIICVANLVDHHDATGLLVNEHHDGGDDNDVPA